jgi:hypothetical protein
MGGLSTDLKNMANSENGKGGFMVGKVEKIIQKPENKIVNLTRKYILADKTIVFSEHEVFNVVVMATR